MSIIMTLEENEVILAVLDSALKNRQSGQDNALDVTDIILVISFWQCLLFRALKIDNIAKVKRS